MQITLSAPGRAATFGGLFLLLAAITLSVWPLATHHAHPAAGPVAYHAPAAAKAAIIAPVRAATPDPVRPARPFVLTAGSADRQRAVECLTQAVYYEAGFEPIAGERAVAQVVLNRVRHPIFPHSVCGVVFQGAELKTGCQFSFACDGSLGRPPQKAAWLRAKTVAEAALNGFVEPEVGEATHYHTQAVSPWWEGTVARITQIGAHIFYRWPGALGSPSAFSQHYSGHEQVIVASAGPQKAATPVPAAPAAATAPTVVADVSQPQDDPAALSPTMRRLILAAQHKLGAEPDPAAQTAALATTGG